MLDVADFIISKKRQGDEALGRPVSVLPGKTGLYCHHKRIFCRGVKNDDF